MSNYWFQDNSGKRLSVFTGQPVGRNGQAVILMTDSRGEPTAFDKPEVYINPGYTASDTIYRIFTWQNDVPWTNDATEQVIGRMKVRSRTVRGYKSRTGMLAGLLVAACRPV
jgi:hypothetical protein